MATYPLDAGITRHPDKNIPYSFGHDVNILQLGGGYEKRILRSRRRTRGYTLEYAGVESDVKNAIEQFEIARNGEFESFEFDLSHIHETGTIRVRFNGQVSVTLVNALSSNRNLYNISFSLIEVAS